VHTGYFLEGTAVAEAPAAGKEEHVLKKGMSSSRLTRVRNILSRFDTMGRSKGAPTANEVPKSSPRVTVFGATGRTGMLVVNLALKVSWNSLRGRIYSCEHAMTYFLIVKINNETNRLLFVFVKLGRLRRVRVCEN